MEPEIIRYVVTPDPDNLNGVGGDDVYEPADHDEAESRAQDEGLCLVEVKYTLQDQDLKGDFRPLHLVLQDESTLQVHIPEPLCKATGDALRRTLSKRRITCDRCINIIEERADEEMHLDQWHKLGGDVSWEDYDGVWGKRVVVPAVPPKPETGERGSKERVLWFVLRFENMEDCDSKAVERGELARYIASVVLVDLAAIPADDMARALGGIVFDAPEGLSPEQAALQEEMCKVDALVSYGVYAPLADKSRSNLPHYLLGEVIKDAQRLIANPCELDAALDQPVNKIGTTAREMGQGKVLAGLERSAVKALAGEEVDATASLMLKMQYKLDAGEMAKAGEWMKLQAEDPIAFYCGWSHGSGEYAERCKQEASSEGELSPAYHAGWEWAQMQKAGKLKDPHGIKKA
jgi:hypothetical protein